MEFQLELTSLKQTPTTVNPGVPVFLAARYYFQYRETPGHNRGVSASHRDATVDSRNKKVQVGKDQEKAQESIRKRSHSKNRGGKKSEKGAIRKGFPLQKPRWEKVTTPW